MAVTVQCAGCGKDIQRFPSRLKPFNFCSRDCANAHQRLTQARATTFTPEQITYLKEHYYEDGPAGCAEYLGIRKESIRIYATKTLGLSTLRSMEPAQEGQKYSKAWIDRFWSYVDKRSDDECWLWTGNLNTHGYGTIRHTPEPHIHKTLPAHAVAFELFHGHKPKFICHTCDIRHCQNPRHMYEGSAEENARDRGERSAWTGSRRNLTWEQAEEIRSLYKKGKSPADLAPTYGVSPSSIYRIIWNNNYKQQHRKSNRRFFTDEQVAEIRTRLAKGEKPSVLAREHNVSDAVIQHIKNRRTYAYLP